MIRWVDPRDQRTWLVTRRRFSHGCYGYMPQSVVQLASASEIWFVAEAPGTVPPLDGAYLMRLLDSARSPVTWQVVGEPSGGMIR